MKTEWDYTNLAKSYIKRPKYSPHAIQSMISIAECDNNTIACDVGAGVAHLTLNLLERNINVVAIEPNDSMRSLGIERTKIYNNVSWFEATGEETNQPDSKFDIVTFGSSFNVCNREYALKEAKRILKPNGWFACMWNHRDLKSPIQSEIESIIKNSISDYSYGTRREDQSTTIEKCGLFDQVISVSSKVIHSQSIDECIEAWRSHATLQRQSKEKFKAIIDSIESLLIDLKVPKIEIPYETKIWMAKSL